ncbi:hypothetical protein [Paraclostridium bifermentans]|uniref:hypothetical protein n=1 Tax=Paraclostridium bifermentans TaxID=1490 RepID=UPI00242E5F54|nr:hypothetical protein [Paraclostridium bifermentans]
MNDIDKTLIKYGFTKTPIQDEKLDKLAETTNKKIDRYIGKAKKKREHIVNKELKTINEIMNLNDDFIVTRSDFTIESHLNKDYVVGECFVDMNNKKRFE